MNTNQADKGIPAGGIPATAPTSAPPIRQEEQGQQSRQDEQGPQEAGYATVESGGCWYHEDALKTGDSVK